jgi:hypothetical protein
MKQITLIVGILIGVLVVLSLDYYYNPSLQQKDQQALQESQQQAIQRKGQQALEQSQHMS